MIFTELGPRWVTWTERPVSSYDHPARRFYVLRAWAPYDATRHLLLSTFDGTAVGAMRDADAAEAHDVLRSALGGAYLDWAQQGFVEYQFAGETLELYADFPIDFPAEFVGM